MRVCLITIATLAVLAGLDYIANIAAPFVLSVFTGIILLPLTKRLQRIGIPRGLSAIIVLIVAVFVLAALIFLIEPLVWRLVDVIPRIRWEMKSMIGDFRAFVQGLDQISTEVEQTLGEGGAAGAAEEGDAAASVMPSLSDTLFMAPLVASQVLIFVGGFFFFLIGREDLYRSIAVRCVGEHHCNAVLDRIRHAERLVARYFITVTMINAGLGACLAGVLTLLGMDYALVWGAAAMLLNYVIYLGPTVVIGALLVAGLLAFDGLMSFAPALAFFLINMVEAQFVTPSLVGKHVDLNPMLVFLSIVFWFFLWGPLGAIVAIPILVATVSLIEG
ncbi:AI-2E family transporter [Aquicoccus sp. SCR17]|nr:AI-2E family transporter [Carideicomes alvinocaridis]